MLRPVARGVSINIFSCLFLGFFEHLNHPQVVRKPVHFILLLDRPSNHTACIEIDIKAREIQLT